jgi:hypothetical protein
MREYRPGVDEAPGYQGAAEQYGEEPREVATTWIDGYGRSYGGFGAADAEAENPAVLTRKDVRSRMSPWRGYNSDCDRNR